jgi:hypothetical protein
MATAASAQAGLSRAVYHTYLHPQLYDQTSTKLLPLMPYAFFIIFFVSWNE